MRFTYIISKILKKIHFPALKNSKIHKECYIGSASHLVDCNMDKYSYVGNNCSIINVDIGRYCSIADNCIIGGSSHPLDWVSTSPVFYQGKNVFNKNISNLQFQATKKTKIGHDIWIGSNCLIKGGVTIGHGSIIGMGSVVTKDIGNYEIWAGNPAKLIKRRFNEEDSEKLEELKWWDLPIEELQKYGDYVNEVPYFIERVRMEGKN